MKVPTQFQKLVVSLLPRMPRQSIPKFPKTATPVPQTIRTQSWNRVPPVEDALGDLFLIGRTFNSLLSVWRNVNF